MLKGNLIGADGGLISPGGGAGRAAYHPASLAYFAVMATPPSAGFKNVINKFVVGLMTDNNWDNIDCLWVLASENDNDYKYNLKNPGVTGTIDWPDSQPIWTQYTGTYGDGSPPAWHRTNIAHNSLTIATEDSTSFFFERVTSATDSSGYMSIFGENWTTFQFSVGDTDNYHSMRINTLTNSPFSTTGQPYSTVPDYWVGTRVASNESYVYRNSGTALSSSTNDSTHAPTSDTINIHRSSTAYGNATIGVLGIGGGVTGTQAGQLISRMQTLRAGLDALKA